MSDEDLNPTKEPLERRNAALIQRIRFFNHELPKSEGIATALKTGEQKRLNGKREEICARKAQWCAKEEER